MPISRIDQLTVEVPFSQDSSQEFVAIGENYIK
jgi:hypothetical protein